LNYLEIHERFYLAFLIGLMPVLVCSVTEQANAAGPITLEMYDPSGATEITAVHAPRLDTLAGKTICEASTAGRWQADRMFPAIRKLMQNQYPTAKIIPYNEFPDVYGDLEDLSKLAKKKGCQAFIVGNAG
jgi:hypothetical protein